MKPFFSRIVQFLMRVLAVFVRIPEPKLYSGHKLFHKVIDIFNYHQIKSVLIVTDPQLIQLKLLDPLLILLNQNQIQNHIYQDTHVNPTITNLEEAKTLFQKHQCHAILGFGGGSSLDCAKGAAALIAANKTVLELKGLLKVRKKPPLMVMLPTTAGTGSEATVAVVVSNPKTKEKFAINDPVLVPSYAILDSALTIGLPPHLTATTGMDAMTHAIEAFLGKSNTPFTIKHAKEALILINKFLLVSFEHPDQEIARRKMLEASYHAGLAFTRAYVGYVHGIAHTLGGFYQFPHGHANAIILPHVLEVYGKTIHHKLAVMSDWLSLTSMEAPEIVKAKAFKEWVIMHIEKLNIVNTLPNVLNGSDIPAMIARVEAEVYPFYPVPRYLTKNELSRIYHTIGDIH